MPKAKQALVHVEAAKLAAWRARRQHIEPPSKPRSLEQVATDLVGIQAQVASAAALSLALRTRDGPVAGDDQAGLAGLSQTARILPVCPLHVRS